MHIHGYSGKINQIILNTSPIIISANKIYTKNRVINLLKKVQKISFADKDIIYKFKHHLMFKNSSYPCDNYFVLKNQLFLIKNNKVFGITPDTDLKVVLSLEYKIERCAVYCDTLFLFSSTQQSALDICYDVLVDCKERSDFGVNSIIFVYSRNFSLLKTFLLKGEIRNVVVGKNVVVDRGELVVIDYVNDKFKIYKEGNGFFSFSFIKSNIPKFPEKIIKMGHLIWDGKNVLVVCGDEKILFYEIRGVDLVGMTNFTREYEGVEQNLISPENGPSSLNSSSKIFKVKMNKINESFKDDKLVAEVFNDDHIFSQVVFKPDDYEKFTDFHISANQLFLESESMVWWAGYGYLTGKCSFVYKDIFVTPKGVFYKNIYENMKFVAYYNNLICTDNHLLYVFSENLPIKIINGRYLYENIFEYKGKCYTFDGDEKTRDLEEMAEFTDTEKYKFIKKIGTLVYGIKNDEINVFDSNGELIGDILLDIKSFCYTSEKLYVLSGNELNVYSDTVCKYKVGFDEIFSVFDDKWILILRIGHEFYQFPEVTFPEEIGVYITEEKQNNIEDVNDETIYFKKINSIKTFFGTDFNTNIFSERYDDLEKMTYDVEKLCENTRTLRNNARKMKEKIKKKRWFW